MRTITKTVSKYPKDIYVEVVCAIRFEWTFFKHLTKDTGHASGGVEKFLWGVLLPCIFSRESKYIPSIIGTLSKMLFKKYGIGQQDPVTSSNEKYLSLLCVSIKMIGGIIGASEFSTANRLQAVKEEKCGGKKTWDCVNDSKL